MLAITGAQRIWYIKDVRNVRNGRYSLFEKVRECFPNPYNGDLFAFLSKDRRLMKL